MKLLLVSPFSSTSGSAIRFWNLALQFKANGYDVVYIDRGSRTGKHLYRSDGIEYRPGRIVSPLILDILLSTLYNVFLLLRHIDCLAFYALKPAPNNCFPALIAKLLGKKVLLDIDDLDYAYFPSGIKRSVSRFFFHFFPPFFSLTTCHTSRLLAYCKNSLNLPDHRLYFLKQGVSSEFLRIEPGENRTIGKSLLYVATLGITSDFEDLIPMLDRICRLQTDATITVVGDGPRRRYFEDSMKSRGIGSAVTFVGQVDHARLPEIMASHYIGINYMRPTEVNECRAILKIREYLACGLQVVCNNTGDASEFSGVAYVADDIEEMEKKIIHLLDVPMGKNHAGREFVARRYAWDAIFNDFLTLLDHKKLITKNHT